jgi:hypothetical protein
MGPSTASLELPFRACLSVAGISMMVRSASRRASNSCCILHWNTVDHRQSGSLASRGMTSGDEHQSVCHQVDDGLFQKTVENRQRACTSLGVLAMEVSSHTGKSLRMKTWLLVITLTSQSIGGCHTALERSGRS